MAYIRVVAAFILTAVLYVTLIDSAAVRSEEFSARLERLAQVGELEKMRIQRAIENETPSKHICYKQPCAWAIYEQFTRHVKSYITNICDCPDVKDKCVRTDDDLSASAYVYRCRRNITEDDIIAPKDAI